MSSVISPTNVGEAVGCPAGAELVGNGVGPNVVGGLLGDAVGDVDGF